MSLKSKMKKLELQNEKSKKIALELKQEIEKLEKGVKTTKSKSVKIETKGGKK